MSEEEEENKIDLEVADAMLGEIRTIEDIQKICLSIIGFNTDTLNGVEQTIQSHECTHSLINGHYIEACNMYDLHVILRKEKPSDGFRRCWAIQYSVALFKDMLARMRHGFHCPTDTMPTPLDYTTLVEASKKEKEDLLSLLKS